MDMYTHLFIMCLNLNQATIEGGFSVPGADYITTDCHGRKSKPAIITSVHLIWA